MSNMSRLPTGTVSLLFSDIEGSTRLVHRLGLEYAAALAVHRELLRQAWEAHAGVEMGTEGDSFYVAFSAALDAVAAAIQAQRALQTQSWPQGVRVRIRIGIHTGSPGLADGAYVGLDVHRAARIAAVAHGGQIVVSAATAELVRSDLPAGVCLMDLGIHRLKDLPRSEHLLQVQAEDLDSRFPELRSLGASSRLPIASTPLIDRDEERTQVIGVIIEQGTRLLTLTGPGGSGKTRLALDVALRLNDRFRDGVYFTALDSATTAEEMGTAIAQTLDISPDSAASEAPWAEASHRNALLVLDSLEQVVGAREALEQLMVGAPQIVVVATSRRPLHIAGEHEHAVPPLELPPDGAGLDAATRSAAVEMFVRQARLVRPSFAVNEDNVADVVTICRRLDGLPLALELAASQARMLTPHAILQRLDGALDLPSRVHAATRQRTLRSTISWSYGLLSPTLQGHFRRMGVFAGGADLAAVAAVVVEGRGETFDPLDLLDELLDASAVRITETPDGELRADMLETIRNFALDELTANGELDQVRERHARHYLAAAQKVGEATDRALFARWSEPRANSWFEIEDANLREAVVWALSRGAEWSLERRRLGLQLCSASGGWWASCAAVERASWLQRAVDLAGSQEKPALARCLLWLSALRRVAGDWEGAQHHARACLDLSRRLDDSTVLASALSHLAGLEMFSGRPSEASRLLQEGIEIAKVSGDTRYLLGAALDQAIIEDLNGNHVRSLERNADALALANQLGDEHAVRVARHNTAYTLLLMGRSSEAEEQMRRLIPDFVSAEKPLDLLPVAEDYAAILVAVHDEVQAAVLLGAAQRLRSQLGIPVAVHQHEMVEDAMSSIRQTLGPLAWERAYRSGERTGLADALAAAASATQTTRPETDHRPAPCDGSV
jgi:predicted ATPase/class 3 adenylate cyclase